MLSMQTGLVVISVMAAFSAFPEDRLSKKGPKESLRPLNDLVGSWRGTGTPEGTREQKQRGFWTETITWSWQFKDEDAWLKASFEKGKHFSAAELRYVPGQDLFQLVVLTPDKETLTFQGRLVKNQLAVERENKEKNQAERIVLTLLHSNRFLYRYEIKAKDRSLFTRLYEVGATKEGVAFATGSDTTPECIVTGGRGTIAVSYKGQTYHVCCTGCRDAFNDNPDKYLKEFAERKAQEAKEKKP
jgi:YHS domain-containing protein